MISGEKKQNLEQQIKKNLSDYDIYRMFCPTKFTIGKKFSSPIPSRRDDNPSFLIGCKNGNYFHMDFGASEFRGDSIDFVKQLLSTDYSGALEAIGNRFGLSSGKWKQIINQYEQPKIEVEKEISIQYTKKGFTKEAHEYWNAYHLTEDYLSKNMVYQVKDLFISRKRYPLPKGEIVFVYDTPEERRKIYRPTVPRKSKDHWRFKGNLPFTYIFGKENIKNCSKSLIIKSYKDQLVTSLILPCVCSVQGESIACFSKENVDYINQNSQETYLLFGADDQGVKESKLITESFGWKYWNTPRKYLPANDMSEVAKLHGLEILEKLLKQKNII